MPLAQTRRQQVIGWATLAVSIAVFWGLFALIKLPSQALFGALTGSLVHAVSGWFPNVDLPKAGSLIGQALVGTVMGAMVDLPTLVALGDHWVSTLIVCAATFALSLVIGRIFALHPEVSNATGAFSMVAGGASGVTAIARELGADDRVVGVVQYLRVLIIVVFMPIVTAVVFHPPSTGAIAGSDYTAAPWQVAVFLVASLAGGLLLSRLIPFAAGSLLWPLLVSATISISGVLGDVGAPAIISIAGYLLIGMQVGLRFTRASLRSIQRVLPLAIGLIVALGVVSAGFGVVLAYFTGVTQLDAYLATTPGGLWAVLVTAADAGADVTFVLAVQVIRLLMVLFAAPFLAAWFRRRRDSDDGLGA